VLNAILGFVPLPMTLLGATAAIVVAYTGASELAKRRISVLGPTVTTEAAA
jgi:hypothetical protein